MLIRDHRSCRRREISSIDKVVLTLFYVLTVAVLIGVFVYVEIDDRYRESCYHNLDEYITRYDADDYIIAIDVSTGYAGLYFGPDVIEHFHVDISSEVWKSVTRSYRRVINSNSLDDRGIIVDGADFKARIESAGIPTILCNLTDNRD